MRFKTKRLVLIFIIALIPFTLHIEQGSQLFERVITYSFDKN
ncbi:MULTISPECIES: hypothetical protein [Bacillus]|uniref:Uncharacterized protein n=1 Tax=Bacillus capparidis TaxID=1840411 RepID=A0ABS4CVD1_9BACI|nr:MULTISPECIES: hypothetical protein [Bacillus]MBP1081501.1 hypothetical protein [Bacillus capparidis]MED1096168.1 hypothetical protein [Bacillus capparidis]